MMSPKKVMTGVSCDFALLTNSLEFEIFENSQKSLRGTGRERQDVCRLVVSCIVSGPGRMSHSTSSSSRNDAPPKRKKASTPKQSDAALPPSKRMKNNKKTSIPQRTIEKEKHDFQSEVRGIEMHNLEITLHSLRSYGQSKQLFKAISQYLFPLISQKRHYFRSLKVIKVVFCPNRFDPKDWKFINKCFSLFSSLPNLRALEFEIYSTTTEENEVELDFLNL